MVTVNLVRDHKQINAIYFADGAPPLLIWMTAKEKEFLRIKIEACLELTGKIPHDSSTFASHGFMLCGVWINPKMITRVTVIDDKKAQESMQPLEFTIE
jgi:hypothetical protein